VFWGQDAKIKLYGDDVTAIKLDGDLTNVVVSGFEIEGSADVDSLQRGIQIDNVTEMYYIGISDLGSGGITTAKYGDSRRNFPVIRLAEMYVTRAEGNFEAGTAHGADPMEDINTLRTRAGANALPSVDRDIIRMERYLELCWEGFRLHDLKRWKENIGEYPYNAGNLILPIPEREMEANDKLVQNPYYTGG